MNKVKLASLLFFLFVPFNLYSQITEINSYIENRALEIEDEVIEWRRHFHQNPELSNREFETGNFIAEYLKSLGLDVQTGVAHTGVVGILKGAKQGPVVALRADIDALPVKERTPLAFASTTTGVYRGEEVPVMHACGHDTHIAMLMGAAKILTELKDELNGTIKFIFQPAEEGAPVGEEGGAELMVKEGVLKNPDVDAIFGIHISDDTPVGTIEYRPEGIMASVNSFTIDIKGKQAHGSRPWTGVDPIVTGAQIVNNIQTIVSRSMPLTEQAAVVTVGVFEGGVRSNIIPESVFMEGTIRALDEDMRQLIFKRLETIVEHTAKSNGAEAVLTINDGYPITYNDVALTDMMIPTLEDVSEELVLVPAITGAEDFSFFQKEIPGLYIFVGGLPSGKNPEDAAGHHTPDFFIDESGMITGVKAYSRLALDFFEKAKKQ